MALAGYKKLEYIESSGTQYIDTGFKPKGTSRFLANITVLSGERNVFGAYSSYESWTNGLGLYGKYNASWWYHYFSNTDTHYASNTMEIDFSPTYIKLNDNTYNHSSSSTSLNYNLFIFGGNHGGNPGHLASMRLTYFKIYDGETLVRDYIPAKRVSDNAIGLYDNVSATFATNSGTGTFIAGPEIDDEGDLYTNLLAIKAEKDTKIIPENIKSGVEILGITGTYTGSGGSSMKEYNSVTAMNNDIANISEGEVVKVIVSGNDPDYYIKNTTMKELYKEGDTLSPADYELSKLQVANLINYKSIPKEYIEVEYIESSGTQYIDTNLFTNINTSIEITFKNDSTSIDYARLFGAWGSQNFEIVLNNRDTTSYWFVGNGNTSVSHTLDASTEFQTVKMSVYREVTYNNEVIVPALSSYAVNNKIELFRGGNRYGAYKLKRFKVYNGQTILSDFIPVKRKSDNVVGLYDEISGEFFTNQGTGTFTAGPKTLPYTEIEYIQSTGTQYIDMQTTNMLTDGCKVLAAISMTNPTATFQTLFGAEDGGNPYRRNYLIRGNGSWGIGCYDYSSFNYTFTADTIYEVECSTLRNNGYVKMNGTSIGTYNNSGDRTSNSLYMLAFHQGTRAVQLGSYKIYSFKLYNVNGTLIRDFIPVKRDLDDEICLYDRVSKEFFTNQGTGVFIGGEEV